MNWQSVPLCMLISAVSLAGSAATASAQGLVWSLPEDGTWVRYEGAHRQVEFRPDSTEGDVTAEWIRQLTLKSVGQEMAEYEGQMQPCRWIELKVVIGTPSERGIDPGPVGQVIYKVLIPENRVIGETSDADTIPVSYLPVVKGFKKIGDENVTPIDSPVLQVYPLLSLLMHYRTLQAEEADPQPLDIRLGTVTARKYSGSNVTESPTSRSTNEAQIWRAVPNGEPVPFGLARWSVRMVRESKDSTVPRTEFKPASEVVVEMSAHEVGQGAESELVTP